jgi:ferredoxin-NADP reductase
MGQEAYESRLVEKIPRVDDIVSFQLQRPEGYEFKAGQWFVTTFPGPDEPYSHHFSHSNSPSDAVLEFTTRMRDTEFKRNLDALPLGAGVEVEGPYGAFTFPEDSGPLAFIAGGIGITTVRSMLRWFAGKGDGGGLDGRSMVLLFANHSEEGIPFRSELERLEARISGLRVVHIISQPRDDWHGYRGHIHLGIFERELRDPAKWIYLVSGPPSFGESMWEELVAWDVRPESIRMEKYDGY